MERLNFGLPEIQDVELNREVHKNMFWAMAGELTPYQIEFAYGVVGAAKEVLPQLLAKHGKKGCMLGISERKEGAAIMYIQIGEVDLPDDEYIGGKKTKYCDFIRGKIEYLQDRMEFMITRSSMNEKIGDNKKKTKITGKLVPGGAVSFGDHLIAISGLSSDPKEDENAVFKIARKLNLVEE